MATQTQIDAKVDTVLVDKEIDRVREILESDGTGNAALESDLNDRLDAISAVQRQRLRAYINDWDAIPPMPVRKEGGAKGTFYDTDKHQAQVRARLRVLLGYSAKSGTGGIKRIGYNTGVGCPGYEDTL